MVNSKSGLPRVVWVPTEASSHTFPPVPVVKPNWASVLLEGEATMGIEIDWLKLAATLLLKSRIWATVLSSLTYIWSVINYVL
ncbi:hypothetical protein D3C73_1488500 [compost metagenome]